MKVYVLQQYPSKMRYSVFFGRLIADALVRVGQYDVELINDIKDTSNKLTDKDFLPHLESINYELECLKELHNKLKPSDIIIALDPSFPGYVANLRTWFDGLLFCYCHATSLNTNDIFERKRHYKWQLEKAFLNSCNGIFVASEYHKNKLCKAGVEKDKIFVVGFPVPPLIDEHYYSYSLSCSKNGRGIIVSRNVQKIDHVIYSQIKNELPIDIKYYDNWSDYYKALCEYSVLVSIPLEETFGISPAEAMYLGTPVLVPDKFAYKEYYKQMYKFKSYVDLIRKFRFFVREEFRVPLKDRTIFNKNFNNDIVNVIKQF